MTIFVFGILTDKHFIAPNLNFVNEPDLTRILQSEIFIHTNGQLRAAHIILGYKPISTSFQAPKYVIKAKDPQLHQINIVVPGFLTSPPPVGTHPVELPTQRAPEEEATSSNLTPEEEATRVIKVVDSSEDINEDFRVFNQPRSIESPGATFKHLHPAQVRSIQESSDIPNSMVLQMKPKIGLLELLESHTGGFVLEVSIQTQPLTPLLVHTSPSELADKKRKHDKKGKEVAEEGKVIPSKDLEPQKGAKIAKGA